MALSAYPIPASEVRDLFGGRGATIRELLEKPPALRRAGWDLQTGGQAEIVRGEMVRVANGDRKVLELYRDGTFVFVCRADDWFLAWATPRGQQRINPLALVEVIRSFATVYGGVINQLTAPPHEIGFRIDFRGMHGGGPKASLAPYALNTYAQILDIDSKEAPDNDATLTRTVPARDYDAAAVAYQLVREVYCWFGFNEDQIPYAKREGTTAVIDEAAIVATGH